MRALLFWPSRITTSSSSIHVSNPTYIHDTLCKEFPPHCPLSLNITLSSVLYQPDNQTLHHPHHPSLCVSSPSESLGLCVQTSQAFAYFIRFKLLLVHRQTPFRSLKRTLDGFALRLLARLLTSPAYFFLVYHDSLQMMSTLNFRLSALSLLQGNVSTLHRHSRTT